MKSFLFFALVAAIAFAPACVAAQGTAEQQSACTGDAFQFCGEAIPDAKRVEACLRQKIKSISPACQAQFRPARGGTQPTARVTPVADRHRQY